MEQSAFQRAMDTEMRSCYEDVLRDILREPTWLPMSTPKVSRRVKVLRRLRWYAIRNRVEETISVALHGADQYRDDY